MDITKEIAEELTWAAVGDDIEGHKVVETGEWIHCGKQERKTIVFEFGGSHYRFTMGRKGSDYSEWRYATEDLDVFKCDMVTKVQVTTFEWKTCSPTESK